ncbi:AAA family ATPase [Actinomycetospora lemnae]|uniref:LuxR C-terminal-related transcriptional regulator n=1 Tax=Actinomycetospora lemnae TaxID=3019891 RepID=A0ABT5T1R4_9PSEU|nr:LuxR family transcriptional regulator [Actinomycetospora sp. DW7H6]MDD7969041.1 LuxR C-terminal-related transcriptional regulator [Actinomycetospora sp. DW7H6]
MTTAGDDPPRPPFVGRAAEIDTLGEITTGHRAERVAVVRGEPGIGKTALLARMCARTRARTVRIAGTEAESHLPFAVLADLVAPLRPWLAALPEVQREALEVSVALRAGPTPGPLAVRAAALGLLEVAGDADDGPLLVVVDDLQWVDPASEEVLAFVARRLRSTRVTLLLATRDERRTLSGAVEVDLGRLTPAESRELLCPVADDRSSLVVDRLVADLAGHPLALVENAAHLDADARPRAPRVGPALEELWSCALTALPAGSRTALTVLAAAGTAEREEVDLVLGDLGLHQHDLAPAEHAGLLRRDDDGRPVLRHPLLRPVALAHEPEVTRHVRRALAGRTAGLRRAWHLAARVEGTDEVVGDQLATAARSAGERGGHRSAGEAWARAAQLTADRGHRAGRFLAAAEEFLLAGALDLAAGHAEAALALADDATSRTRAEIVRGRATAWLGDPRRALADLVRAAERLAAEDAEHTDAAAALYAEATTPAAMAGRVRDMLVLARKGTHRRAPEVQALVLTGDVPAALAILDTLEHTDGTAWDLQDRAQLAQVAVVTERYADADRRVDDLLALARRHGTSAMLAFAHAVRAELDVWRGRWPAARADAVEAVAWAEEQGESGTAAFATLVLARLDALTGDIARSREGARRVLAEVGAHGIDCLQVYVPAVEGLAALAVGDTEEAVAHLERAHRRACADGLGASNVVPYGPDLVEALVRHGDTDRAREVLAWWEERAASGLAFPDATAARCRGLLADDPDDAATCFARARAAHARCDQPFEKARTLLAEAECLRRLRRPSVARSAAREAHATFVALGARPWADRAEAELAAAGVSLSRPSTTETAWAVLTPQEYQVARVVAEGRSNDEAAAALFVSRKTVENHLTRVYRKLGLRSRSELVRRFPDGGCGRGVRTEPSRSVIVTDAETGGTRAAVSPGATRRAGRSRPTGGPP